ncbi:3-deoxy-manno-octulosonate cytidylyltransferase [Akkermansiaceae bacterium]|nr:3-deoxy-manno-octulosonate cytidylyltransferase [Akkermansiaceae bacterium]MDA7629484.1 3-deoxy-manno-octulosonate cytidylyltransferase [Akkermansiaceae bacterium]MDB4283112.1 3-deoxy-manno-octulosonate cytidylyltransferase [Akkermansiaceae bacterium]MDB4284022.1 3-deoxy-manno-octulosonate cytidylyltransferase [Akkermansiaceae bacterium]MDB4626902.1 3-deoxy-manno-octulosonate cytidylyltransferase [Akkermansiaceae bacterium]
MIPARWASSRFPGKPLFPLLGKPLLQHVYERAQKCGELDDLVIATDDDRIIALSESIGAKVCRTRADHPSGTDRIAEVADQLEEATHVLNIQGDEPLLDPELVDTLARALRDDDSLPMITAASPITNPEHVADPNIVKVTLTSKGDALYFSRSPIPYRRETVPDLPTYRHLGIYGYRTDFLKHFVSLPPSALEQSEGLEQLRALEDGARIRVHLTEHEAIGLDSPDQVPFIESLLSSCQP